MNKTGRLLLCMAAFATWLFSACDDTMGGSTTLSPVFPTDTMTFVANSGDTVEVAFNATVNWSLSSDVDWCKTEGALTAYGKSGKHTVPFVIGSEGHGFVDDKAKITLGMGGENRVIAIITRRAKGYSIEVCGDRGVYAAGESVVLGTSGDMALNVKTNFSLDQLRINSPKWLKVTRNGETMTLQVVKDSVKYTIDNPSDSLILFNADTTFSRSFHVQYLGMDSRDLRVNPQMDRTLVVSRDARRCHVGDTEYSMPLSFGVEALNDAYELISVAYDAYSGFSLLSDADSWFAIEDDHRGNVGLTFTEENLGDERIAYLLALPQAIVDSLDSVTDSYETAVAAFLGKEENGKISLSEDAQKYCLVNMLQEKSLDWTITISPETRWNLKVSTDGTTYDDAISGKVCDAPVKAFVEGAYQLMCAAYDSKTGCTLVSVEDSWLNVAYDELDSIEVRFDANDANERTLLLLALPQPLVESMNPGSSEFYADLSGELFEDVDGLLEIKVETEQYVIAKFVQEANENNAMKVFDKSFKPIDVVKETDPEWLAIAEAKGVAAGKVFRCSMKVGFAYTINPLISLSVWDTSDAANHDRIEVYKKNGEQYVSGDGNDYEENHVIMDEIEGSDNMLVILSCDRKKIAEDFIIYFVDDDTDYLKALVVTRL